MVQFETSPYIASFKNSPSVTLFPFENRDNMQVVCWAPAKTPAEDFCKKNNIADPNEKLFNGDRPLITFFLPVFDKEANKTVHISKKVRLRGAATIERVFANMADFIKDALVHTHGPKEGVELYGRFHTCHLMISRVGGHNKAYIRRPA